MKRKVSQIRETQTEYKSEVSMPVRILERHKESKRRFSYRNLKAYGMWMDRKDLSENRLRKDLSKRINSGQIFS